MNQNGGIHKGGFAVLCHRNGGSESPGILSISTRYLLSRHMDEEQGSLLRSDILENLGRRHYDSPAYQLFKELLYDGGDPMEFRDYLIKVQKACKGEWPCWH